MPDNKSQWVEKRNNSETPKKRSFFWWSLDAHSKDFLDFRYNTQEEIDKLNEEMTTADDLDEIIKQTNSRENIDSDNTNWDEKNEEYIREKDKKEAEINLKENLKWIDDSSKNDGLNDDYNEIYTKENKAIEWEVVEDINTKDESEDKTDNQNKKDDILNEPNSTVNIEKDEITDEDSIKENDESQEIKETTKNSEENEENISDNVWNNNKFFDPFEVDFDEELETEWEDDKESEWDEEIFDPFELEKGNDDIDENIDKEDEEVNDEDNDNIEDDFKDLENKNNDIDENTDKEDEEINDENNDNIENDFEDFEDENNDIDESDDKENEDINNEDNDNIEDDFEDLENENDDANENTDKEDEEVNDEVNDNIEDDFEDLENENNNINQENKNTDEEETDEEETGENTKEKNNASAPTINIDQDKKDEDSKKTNKKKKNSTTWETITDEEIELEQWQDIPNTETDEEYQPSAEEIFEQEPEFFADDELSQQFMHLVQNVRWIFKIERKNWEQNPYFKILWWKTADSILEYLFYLIEEKDEPIDLYIKKVETDKESEEGNEHLVQFSYNEDKELDIFVDEVILYETINKADSNTTEYNDTKAILEKFIFLTENRYTKLKAELDKQREEKQKKKQLQQIFKGF